MGWTFTHKEKRESVKSFFEQEFNYKEEDGRYGKILDCAVVNLRTAYISYEIGSMNDRKVVGLVCRAHCS